jgi:hypothetical protein
MTDVHIQIFLRIIFVNNKAKLVIKTLDYRILLIIFLSFNIQTILQCVVVKDVWDQVFLVYGPCFIGPREIKFIPFYFTMNCK